MNLLSPSVMFLTIILGASPLYAQKIYTWTDENGVTHITDQAPPKKAEVQDVIKYKEKTPEDQKAIERKIDRLREQNERQEKIDAAQRAAVAAKEADERAKEAVKKAREETELNQDYIRKLSTRRWKRRQFRKRIERLKNETEASQAEADALVQQAQDAALSAQEAAAEARETQ